MPPSTDTAGAAAAHARLGRWYADVRDRRGWTQAQVARIAGLSESRVRQIERARVAAPSDDAMLRMEAALGLPRGSSAAVLAGRPAGVELDKLPPITMTDAAGAQQVIYAGPVDTDRLAEAAAQLAAKYLDPA